MLPVQTPTLPDFDLVLHRFTEGEMLWIEPDDGVCCLAEYPAGFRFQVRMILSWVAPPGFAWLEGFVLDEQGYLDSARQLCVPFSQQRTEPLVPRGTFPDDEVLVGPPAGYTRIH